jgi:hypothetical protein
MVSAMTDEERASIMNEARRNVWQRADDDGCVVEKRNAQPLIYKTTVTPEPEHVVRRAESNSDDPSAWKEWVQAHIRNAIEQEREVIGAVIAKMCDGVVDQLRAEMSRSIASEVKAISARVDMLKDIVSGLLARGHEASSDVHKQLTDSEVALTQLRGELSRLSTEAEPLLANYHDRPARNQ